MKEQRADVARGTGYAILLHAILIGLLLFGLHRVHVQAGDAGDAGALQAQVATVGDLSAKTRRALLGEPKEAEASLPKPVEATPPPVPEPKSEPVVKETPPPKPEPKPEPKPAPVKHEPPKPMARVEPQPVPKQTAREVAAQAAAAAKSARAASLAKQRAEQMADARMRNPAEASAQVDATMSGARGGKASGRSNSNLLDKWKTAVGRAIEAKWVRPDDIPPGQACPIHIRMIYGGEVISAKVEPGCPYSEEAKRSVERAVLDASPLPFKGYEDVYLRDFTANFRPSR